MTAFIASKWWPNNKGHAHLVPNPHFENIFDLPSDYAAAIQHAAQLTATAMKSTYECAGISTASIMNLRVIKMCGITTFMLSQDLWTISSISSKVHVRIIF
ncbi:HIT family protein [Paenibacillus sp. TSA_86.1]|uniref:HIT family protein n=1 Tax=Paenibacillus sp. TSA_86.1 TaxID=3415649 RepID=UPI004045743F